MPVILDWYHVEKEVQKYIPFSERSPVFLGERSVFGSMKEVTYDRENTTYSIIKTVPFS